MKQTITIHVDTDKEEIEVVFPNGSKWLLSDGSVTTTRKPEEVIPEDYEDGFRRFKPGKAVSLSVVGVLKP